MTTFMWVLHASIILQYNFRIKARSTRYYKIPQNHQNNFISELSDTFFFFPTIFPGNALIYFSYYNFVIILEYRSSSVFSLKGLIKTILVVLKNFF